MAAQKGSSTSVKKAKKTMSKEEKEKLEIKEQLTRDQLKKKREIHDEIIAIILIAIGIFLIVSLQTGATGALGVFVQNLLLGLFGRVAYALPYFLIVYSILIFAKKSAFVTVRSWASIILLFLLASAFNGSFFPQLVKGQDTFKSIYKAGSQSGGVVGMYISKWLVGLIGKAGLYIVCVTGIIITLLFIINTPLSVLFDNLKLKTEAASKALEQRRLELEAENQKREAEAKLKADMAAREAAKAAKASKQKKEESIEVPVSPSKPEHPVNSEPVETPILNTEALGKFEHDIVEEPAEESEPEFEAVQEPEPVKEPEVNPFTPESIGLTRAQEMEMAVEAFPDSEYSQKQKQILGYVKADETYGMLGRDSSRHGLTGTETVNNTPEPVKAPETAEIKPSGPSHVSAPSHVDDRTVDAPSTPAEVAAHFGHTEAATASAEPVKPEYKFPPISLLKKPAASKDSNGQSLHDTAALLEATLKSFGVNATVVNAIKGPAVTRFEVKPAAGVKVSSITKLQDDIALNLRAKSLRIEAPIPGKAAVGVEVSNDVINTVFLREVLESQEFTKAKSKISVGLGRTIAGDCQVADLKKMPHLLIAGSTGSGKSVCINSIVMSILYKAKPEEVKLIMVDPKVVELSNYNGIPHLLIPVVTDPAKASAALGWAVSEMNDRYNKFAETGTRDLESYNDYVIGEDEEDKVLPQIVIIIDELADLIMAAQNSVEDSICRLAQKARAAGMHLIVATQRPSVDVITGVIKANIPSRIAFAVSSQIDSRTILDSVGAEKLLGKGDMLYYPAGIPKPVRVQGCFVSDEEVNNVIDFVKKNSETQVYSQDVITALDNAGTGSAAKNEDDGTDELLTDAIECVVRAGKASVSMLQRRFRIGYNRAARLVDLMEERGIVAPAEGMGPRRVLMTVAQFEQLASEVQEAKDFMEEHPEFKEEV